MAAVGVLAAAAVSGTIVFTLSSLIRGDKLVPGLSAFDPMLLAAAEPMAEIPSVRKMSRLPVLSNSQMLTADAIRAAYQRQLASTETQNRTTSVAVPASKLDIADAGLHPVPVPGTASVHDADPPALQSRDNSKPQPETRRTEPGDQKAIPTFAEIGKSTAQAADHPDNSPKDASSAKASGSLLFNRRVPTATLSSGFDWLGRNNRVAVYDVSAGLVYLPDGEQLEAHSGVGRMRDNPSFAHVRMRGPTPPAIYALSLREQVFHGVDAIRLTPVNGTAPFGRDGLLAHTYMLRRPGDSNGCVAFANYARFLKAFRNNEVNYMLVVPQLQDRFTGLKVAPAQG